MKFCPKCKENKPKSLFNKDKSGKDGLQNQCKTCRAAYKKDWNLANVEKIKMYNKSRSQNYNKVLCLTPEQREKEKFTQKNGTLKIKKNKILPVNFGDSTIQKK